MFYFGQEGQPLERGSRSRRPSQRFKGDFVSVPPTDKKGNEVKKKPTKTRKTKKQAHEYDDSDSDNDVPLISIKEDKSAKQPEEDDDTSDSDNDIPLLR